jgi:hypothetical protein
MQQPREQPFLLSRPDSLFLLARFAFEMLPRDSPSHHYQQTLDSREKTNTCTIDYGYI